MLPRQKNRMIHTNGYHMQPLGNAKDRNKTGGSHMAAETVEEERNLQFIRPNQRRWDSTYMAVERIIQIMQDKGEGAIRNVWEKFKVKM